MALYISTRMVKVNPNCGRPHYAKASSGRDRSGKPTAERNVRGCEDLERIARKPPKIKYQYAIADHQGNTRVLFTSAAPAAQPVAADFEAATNANFQNYVNRSTFTLFNRTAGGTTSQLLNGGVNGQVGLAKTYRIYAGDKVKIEAYGKYTNATSSSSNLTGFATALLSAYALPAPVGGEVGTPSAALNTWGGLVTGGSGGSGTVKAFVNIIVFDKNYRLLDMMWDPIDASANQVGATPIIAHDYMMREYTAKEESIVYMYVSNESPTLVDVYFDDVTMTYTPSNIVQYNEYYPFQNPTQNSWTRVNSTKNNFLGNGGTELNTNSQLYDLEYRNYDPILGRMNGVDPMASKYSSLSPYNFSFNSPVMFNDPSGADPPQTVNGSATTSPYYTMYTYDDRIDPTGLGAQTICSQCWREGNAGAMAFYGASRGREFGMSMSFGALPYSAAGRAYAAQMRSDASGLSTEAYGAKYGTSISIPQAMAMQGEYNRWVYANSPDLQMGVSMELFRQRNALPSLSPSNHLQSLFDQIDLNEFVSFYFGKEFAKVSEKFKLVVSWDFLGLTTTEKPGNTTPVWNKREIQIVLDPSIQKNGKLVYAVIGHEMVHAMDIANGNLRFWNRMVNGNYERLEALMEFHAYQWSLSAEEGLGENFGGRDGYLKYQGLLGYFGIKFSLPPR